MAERLQADGAGDVALQRPTGQHEQVGKLLSLPVELRTHGAARLPPISGFTEHMCAFYLRISGGGSLICLWRLDRMTQISLMTTSACFVGDTDLDTGAGGHDD